MIETAFALSLALVGQVPALGDQPAPAGVIQGPSSARLAKEVAVSFASAAVNGATPVLGQSGERTRGETRVPAEVLGAHGLEIARRHFSDAKWSPGLSAGDLLAGKAGKKAKRALKKGRAVVVKSISLKATQGPVYTAVVVVDRMENGRRLGQATGTAVATPDRSRQRQTAAFAPGLLGAVAARKASTPRADKDEAAIRTATLRALDSAFLQLAAYWAAEQQAEDMRRKAR